MGAIKHDAGKPRYDLISPYALEALARVLAYGATKYGERNWENGVSDPAFHGRVFAAGQRHAWAPMRGEQRDPETGYPHSWHELCNAMFKVHYDAINGLKPEARTNWIEAMLERSEDEEPGSLKNGEAYREPENYGGTD